MAESLNGRPTDTEPTIEVRRPRPDVLLVVLGGEHDLESAPLVEQAAGEALLTDSHLIVDLSPTQFIDSSIINLLVSLRNEANTNDRRFNLVLRKAPSVKRTLEICNVLQVLNCAPSVETALAAATTPGGGRAEAGVPPIGYADGRT
jgi:anti-anti-sigma factor